MGIKEIIIYASTVISILIGIDYLTKKYFLKFLRKIKFQIFNETVRIKATYIEKFKEEPIRWLDFDIYKEIRDSLGSHKISKRGINERCIQIDSEKLGMSIGIWLDEEISSFNSNNSKIDNYRIKIEMQNEIRLSHKNFDILEDFLILKERAREIIQKRCFPSPSESFQKFIICDIKRDQEPLTRKRGRYSDDDLNGYVSILDKKISLNLRDPIKLVGGVKKYYAV